MNFGLSAVKWQFALLYLDDNVSFSRSKAEHSDHVEHVLRSLRNTFVGLNLKNFIYFSNKKITWDTLVALCT